ncbi:MAG: hypothetical protein ACRDRZ_00035 [Pseudonocardiaceae bacterium]
MRRVVLDTDVASLSIKQQLPPVLVRELIGVQVGITFVTLGELTRWPSPAPSTPATWCCPSGHLGDVDIRGEIDRRPPAAVAGCGG